MQEWHEVLKPLSLFFDEVMFSYSRFSPMQHTQLTEVLVKLERHLESVSDVYTSTLIKSNMATAFINLSRAPKAFKYSSECATSLSNDNDILNLFNEEKGMQLLAVQMPKQMRDKLMILMSSYLTMTLSAMELPNEKKPELIYLVSKIKQGYQIANKVFSDVGLMAKFKNVLKSLLSGRYSAETSRNRIKTSISPPKPALKKTLQNNFPSMDNIKKMLSTRRMTQTANNEKSNDDIEKQKTERNTPIAISKLNLNGIKPEGQINNKNLIIPTSAIRSNQLFFPSDINPTPASKEDSSKKQRFINLGSPSKGNSSTSFISPMKRVNLMKSPPLFKVYCRDERESEVKESKSMKLIRSVQSTPRLESDSMNQNPSSGVLSMVQVGKSTKQNIMDIISNRIRTFKTEKELMNGDFRVKCTPSKEGSLEMIRASLRASANVTRASSIGKVEKIPNDEETSGGDKNEISFRERLRVPEMTEIKKKNIRKGGFSIELEKVLDRKNKGNTANDEYMKGCLSPKKSHCTEISEADKEEESEPKANDSKPNSDSQRRGTARKAYKKGFNIKISNIPDYEYDNPATNSQEKENNLMEIRESGSSPINLPTRQQHSITAKKTSEIGLKPVKPSKDAITQLQSKPNLNKLCKTEPEITAERISWRSNKPDQQKRENTPTQMNQNSTTNGIVDSQLGKLEEVTESSQMIEEHRLSEQIESNKVERGTRLKKGALKTDRKVSMNLQSSIQELVQRDNQKRQWTAVSNVVNHNNYQIQIESGKDKEFGDLRDCSEEYSNNIDWKTEKSIDLKDEFGSKEGVEGEDFVSSNKEKHFKMMMQIKKRNMSTGQMLVQRPETRMKTTLSIASIGPAIKIKDPSHNQFSEKKMQKNTVNTNETNIESRRSEKIRTVQFNPLSKDVNDETKPTISKIPGSRGGPVSRNSETVFNDAKSMVLTQQDYLKVKMKLKPNTLIIDKEKLKENFKGESVTVVRTHTIESYNQTVSCYIVAKQKPESQEFVFELNAYISESGATDSHSSVLSKMRVVSEEINENDFFLLLCQLQLGFVNLSPNFFMVNENLESLMKLLLSNYLKVEINEQLQTIKPVISRTPNFVYQIESVKYSNSEYLASLVHNESRNFWLVLQSRISNK